MCCIRVVLVIIDYFASVVVVDVDIVVAVDGISAKKMKVEFRK